jgi:phosphoribosylanthranilate isomerase
VPAPELKFCGLTRAEDAAMAAELGAAYAGAIFAHGPRLLDAARATAMFDGLGASPVARVGVFAAQPVEEVARIADAVRLDVLQLHDGGTPDRLLSLRRLFAGRIWVVVRVSGATVAPVDASVVAAVDGVVLDTAVGGRSGGTGVAFEWQAVEPMVRSWRGHTPVVLAGGLNPANVAQAVRVLSPQVVDVSSGVESAPGIKDHGLMRAFAAAARLREV